SVNEASIWTSLGLFGGRHSSGEAREPGGRAARDTRQVQRSETRRGRVARAMKRVRPLVALLALALAPASAWAADAPTRYSLANGCWSLDGIPGADQVRLQATALGSYLLYRPDRTFVTADPTPAAQPSPAAVWQVKEAPRGAFTFTAPGATRTVHVSPAQGCAVYPEADLDATGTPAPGATSYGRVGGLVEGHMHWMTYEYLGGDFHCGKPWDPYGIPYALPDCSSVEGPQGAAAPVQNFLN